LRDVDLQPARIVWRFQFFKRVRFQQPVIQPVTTAVEMQQLHAVATPVDEDEQAAVGRIGLQLAADDAAESVETFAHVGGRRIQKDLQAAGQAQHDRPPAARVAALDASSSCFTTA
jgi:hypothetical protein